MANHSDRGTALSKALCAVFGTLFIFLVMLPLALTQACASYDTCPGPEHVDFHLVAEKKECADDSGVLKGRYHTVDECADACRGREPFVHFIFANNHPEQDRCDGDGCKCYCEDVVPANCQPESEDGYNLYKCACAIMHRSLPYVRL
jgi:hypothetical protein